MAPCWRTSWYIRGPSTVPSPSVSTSTPWASPGGRPSRRTLKRTTAPEVGGVRTRLRSRLEAERERAPGGAEDGGLLLDDPAAGHRPLVPVQVPGRVDAAN